jgi:hypothetical protein
VCSPYDLSSDPANCYIQDLVAEALNLASAPVNVFKLLGVHEQGQLIDLTGSGTPISSGEYKDYPASFAFNKNFDEWRSTQKGSLVVTASYIGYDFGPIRLDNGRLRYSVDTQVKHHITSIQIQQGCESNNRVVKARIERSNDGVQWFGVDVVTLPDTFNLELISFRQSAASRYWRIRPITFNGGTQDYWAVKQLTLTDLTATQLSNIQDELGFLENRDRSYSADSIQIKGYYDLQEYLTNLSRFGIDMSSTQTYVFKIAFSTAVKMIGRPIVIGDIFEVPSETQYSPTLKPIKKYLEVTDVGWATEGFTPGWKPTLLRVAAMPMLASQETMDIIGDINPPSNLNDFLGIEQSAFNPEAFVSNIRASAAANTQVPEGGEDTANIRVFTDEEIKSAASQGVDLGKFNFNQRGVYVEDGLPPNGEPYTEGTSFPTHPKDGDYHRLTYEAKFNIPVRLHKYSVLKNRWIFVEEDRRSLLVNPKPQLQSLLQDPNKVNNNEITS